VSKGVLGVARLTRGAHERFLRLRRRGGEAGENLPGQRGAQCLVLPGQLQQRRGLLRGLRRVEHGGQSRGENARRLLRGRELADDVLQALALGELRPRNDERDDGRQGGETDAGDGLGGERTTPVLDDRLQELGDGADIAQRSQSGLRRRPLERRRSAVETVSLRQQRRDGNGCCRYIERRD
jgi:hypothetical protein